MKNEQDWKESKFQFRKNKLRASNDKKEVSISSRLMVDRIAVLYDFYLPKFSKGKLLDLGCGKVPFYSCYKPYINEVVCVDWANTIHKNPFLDIECDINQKLPIESDLFNTVILSDVLEHIRKPELLIQEINRVMTKDGHLIMNVPFYYWLHEEPFDYFRYTKHALKSLLEENNFEVVELKEIGGMSDILTDLLSKILFQIPVVGTLSSLLIQGFNNIFTSISIGRKFNQKSANKFPFGYFVVAKKRL